MAQSKNDPDHRTKSQNRKDTSVRTDAAMISELYKAFVAISNEEDCACLLKDLCTPKEVEQMAQRLRAAKLLMEGKTYTQVIEQTNISSATLSRVSRCVQMGDGYRRFVESEREEA